MEFIRKRSVALVLEGKSVAEVAGTFGVNRTTVYDWIRLYDEGGWQALDSHPAPGGDPRLTEQQQCEIATMIAGHDPRDYGMESGLWSRKLVSQLIERTFGISLGITSVGAMLHRWDVVPKKPLRRAYERDPEQIQHWKDTTYPLITKRAAQVDADIVFLDEMGVRSDSPLGRTWGEQGQRSVVETSGKRQSINAISAVSYQGAFWFDLYSGSLNAQGFEQELTQLMRYRRRPLFVILDSLPAHRAQRVERFVQGYEGRLELHFLPGYAPELNPDEYVWNYVKNHGPSKVPLAQGESLAERMHSVLSDTQNDPGKLRNIVQPVVNSYELSANSPIL
jgi:transposase